MIQVYIVDDQNDIIESLRLMIDKSGFAKVAADFNDLKTCREGLATKGLPDVLILDVGLPDGFGDEFCLEILSVYPQLKIMLFSVYDSINIAIRAFNNGALGYVIKHSSVEEILNGVRAVANGEKFLSESLRLLMHNNLMQSARADIFVTKREKEMLKSISEGLSLSEIAARLSLSEETISSYRRDLMLKLSASNADELLHKAKTLNLY